MQECPKCNAKVSTADLGCPACGCKLRKATVDEKKGHFAPRESGGRGKWLLIVGAAASLATGGALMVLRGSPSSISAAHAVVVQAPSVPGAGAAGEKALSFPLAEVGDGAAHYFSHRGPDGREIRFFIVRSADGTVRSAFDACDVCFPAKKGYRQEGDRMICNNCDMAFPSAKINEVKGGCNPSPLANRVENDRLTITVADVLAGSRYF